MGKEIKRCSVGTPGNIVAVRPMKDGVIADFEVKFQRCVSATIAPTTGAHLNSRPRIIIPASPRASPSRSAGAGQALAATARARSTSSKEPMAAAIGAIPITEPSGNMIPSTSAAAPPSGGHLAGRVSSSKSIRDRRRQEMDGRSSSKTQVQPAHPASGPPRTSKTDQRRLPLEEALTMEVKGNRDLVAGVPKTLTIQQRTIRDALSEPVNAIVDAVRVVLETNAAGLLGRYRRQRALSCRAAAAQLKTSICAARTETACRSCPWTPQLAVVLGTGPGPNELALLRSRHSLASLSPAIRRAGRARPGGARQLPEPSVSNAAMNLAGTTARSRRGAGSALGVRPRPARQRSPWVCGSTARCCS